MTTVTRRDFRAEIGLLVTATREYDEARQKLHKAGHQNAVQTVERLEDLIIRYEGFPPNSWNPYDVAMRTIPNVHWQEAVDGLQGEAAAAIQSLMSQRVVTENGLSIFYSIAPETHCRKITLTAVISPELEKYWPAAIIDSPRC